VSLAVPLGEVVGIAGPNGAGKTTLLDVVSGHQRPDGGRVEIDGSDVTRLSAHRRARLGLGRTFQSPLVPTGLTIGQTLEAATVAFRPRADKDETRRARELVRFESPDSAFSGSLDTLERRKLLLAALLLRRPRVLLLDEPCSGLLHDEVEEIDGIIREIAAELEVAIIVVEHRLELLFAVADRVVVMDAGKIIAEGPPKEVFKQPIVRTAYFDTAPRSSG
jgi:ABC-type branched-subunit amino acid transport system ATPase component